MSLLGLLNTSLSYLPFYSFGRWSIESVCVYKCSKATSSAFGLRSDNVCFWWIGAALIYRCSKYFQIPIKKFWCTKFWLNDCIKIQEKCTPPKKRDAEKGPVWNLRLYSIMHLTVQHLVAISLVLLRMTKFLHNQNSTGNNHSNVVTTPFLKSNGRPETHVERVPI